MAKTDFYTTAQLPAVGGTDYPAKFTTLLSLIQQEFEQRDGLARGFFETPALALDNTAHKVDLAWPGGKGALLAGHRLTTAGSWRFAAEPAGTYYLQLDGANAFSLAALEDAGKLTVATVYRDAAGALSALATAPLAANTGLLISGVGGGVGGGTVLQPRGAWTANNYAYTGNAAQRDVVEHAGSGYLCVASHVSGVATEPSAGAGWATCWQLLAGKGVQGDAGNLTPRGAWLAGAGYAANDEVSKGAGYACLQAHTATADNAPDVPGGAAYWQKIVDRGEAGPAGDTAVFTDMGSWSASMGALTKTAARTDLVTHTLPRTGTVYRVLAGHTAAADKEPGTPGGAAYFAVFVPAPAPAALGARKGAWAAGQPYAANDVVTNTRGAWWAKDAHTAGATDEPGVGVNYAAHWEALALSLKGDKGDPGAASTVAGPQGPAGVDGKTAAPAGIWSGAAAYTHPCCVRYNGWSFASKQNSSGQAPDIAADTPYWMRLNADGGAIDGTSANAFNLGDGADNTKTLFANNGDTHKPFMRYNAASNKWEFSNDGQAASELGSGGGAGDVNGPTSSVDGDLAVFSGTGGKTIRESGVGIAQVPLQSTADVRLIVATDGNDSNSGIATALTGTCAIAGTTTISGNGTAFQSELAANMYVVINNETRKIVSVTNNTTAVVTSAFVSTASGQTGYKTTAPLLTIQAAVNRVPKILQNTYNINVAPGTYAESVLILNYSGGVISIFGNPIANTTHSVTAINIQRCQLYISITGFNITTTTYHGIYISNCLAVLISYCKVEGSAATYHGINVGGETFARILNTSCANRQSGILVGIGGVASVSGNSGTSAYGLNAFSGMILKFDNTQCGGTLAAEYESNGGIIVGSSGVKVGTN